MNQKKSQKVLKDSDDVLKEARVEQARRGGRACLATYGKGYYRAMARRRHAKSQEPEQHCQVDTSGL